VIPEAKGAGGECDIDEFDEVDESYISSVALSQIPNTKPKLMNGADQRNDGSDLRVYQTEEVAGNDRVEVSPMVQNTESPVVLDDAKVVNI